MKKTNLLLLTLIVLSVAVFVNAQSVPSGSDYWITNSNTTFDTLSLPAGYFGAGSKAYSGRVYLAGDPSSGNQYDTQIDRTSAVDLSGGSGTTPLVVKELRMKSVAPITVSYDDGHAEQWNVYVTLSGQASTGSMTISGGAGGGSFSSTLNILPKLSFVQVGGLSESMGNGRTVRTLDFGSPFVQKVLQEQARLTRGKIGKGKATSADEFAVAICQIDTPVPTETVPMPQEAAAPAARCGVKLSGNGTWKFDNGIFRPQPLDEISLLASHGVIPWVPRIIRE